jgi:hypothetical protein
MASRSSVSTGVGIALAVLGVAFVASAVLAFVFLARMQDAERQLAEVKTQTQDFVSDAERNSDATRVLLTEAKKNRASLAGYLQNQFRTVADRVTGSPSDTPETLVKKITTDVGDQSAPLLKILADRNAEVATLTRNLQQAEANRAEAATALQSTQDRIKAVEEAHAATIAAMTTEIGGYKSKLDGFTNNMTSKLDESAEAVARIRRESNDTIAQLNGRISALNEEIAVAQGKIKSMQAERLAGSIRPGDEAALVDGQVVAVVDADGTVFINRGRNQRVQLGMTFEVYADAGAIRPTASGEYPRGKAALEIIRVDDNSSTARIARGSRGIPVIAGDVIANAVYDASKKYNFMVFGNFDTNGDGVASPGESTDIKALISSWGGKLVDSISGDVDFVVLGARPVLPPRPAVDAPVAVVTDFLAKSRAADEYDRIFQQASNASIPVLNQNRLLTLTGQ